MVKVCARAPPGQRIGASSQQRGDQISRRVEIKSNLKTSIAQAVQQDPHADVLRVGGLTVVRIPRPPAWL